MTEQKNNIAPEYVEQQFANLVLGKRKDGFKFTVYYGPLALKTSIPFVSSEDVIKASSHISKIRDFDVNETLFNELMKKSKDMRHIAKAIALTTTYPFKWFMYLAIRKLDYEEMFMLWKIVKDRMQGKVFFSTIISAKEMNQLKPTGE